MSIRPPALNKGDKIGVFAPSSWVEENGGTMNAAEEVEAEEEASLTNEQEATIAKAGE